MSWFTSLEPTTEPIELFAIKERFVKDTSPQKVSLNVGAYRDERGEPWVLPCVQAAEKLIDTSNKDYLHTFGSPDFSSTCVKYLLGKENAALLENRAFGIQSLSGTGALRIGAEFLVEVLGKTVFYYSNPTWSIHPIIFQNAGFKETKDYRYWNDQEKGIDFDGLLADLNQAEENSVIILQACAHNPTGSDPTREQWKQIAKVFQNRKLFPFFDCAYQGFASGDLEKDGWAVRYFANLGLEFFCAQSFSKNFSLYNERAGNLCIVTKESKSIPVIQSYFYDIVSGMYLTPPTHAAKIVDYILNDTELLDQWRADTKRMSARIILMRKKLREELERLKTPGCWRHVTDQVGMFSYTGLTKKQSMHIVDKHHVYILSTGRMSMAGLTLDNIKYVAKAMHETIMTVS